MSIPRMLADSFLFFGVVGVVNILIATLLATFKRTWRPHADGVFGLVVFTVITLVVGGIMYANT